MNIYFFGDSISFGQGISLDQIWVTRLGLSFRKDFPDVSFVIQNLSVNGNTTRMALERMPYDIQSHEVDVLFVGFGMNDCNYWQTDRGIPRVSPKAFEANMNEIIHRGFLFGAKEVIVHTNHPSSRNEKFEYADITYQESNEQYNDIIRKVAENDKRVSFIDIDNICRNKILEENHDISDITLDDGIHLSLLGHRYYYEAVYPQIIKIAQKWKF